MIDRINITYDGNIIILDIKNNNYLFNDDKILFDPPKLMDLLRIIRTWKNEYLNDNMIDSTKYEIEVISDNQVDKYIICNKYPDNFNDFLAFLESLHDNK